MIIPYKEENGNIVISVKDFEQLTQQIKDEAYAQGYEDGCSDTYMQCVADITRTSMNIKETQCERKNKTTDKTEDFTNSNKPPLRG